MSACFYMVSMTITLAICNLRYYIYLHCLIHCIVTIFLKCTCTIKLCSIFCLIGRPNMVLLHLVSDYVIISTSWWLHASENPSSILCVVSGHLCGFLSIKTYFQALFILLCQIKHYHTIPYFRVFVKINLYQCQCQCQRPVYI